MWPSIGAQSTSCEIDRLFYTSLLSGVLVLFIAWILFQKISRFIRRKIIGPAPLTPMELLLKEIEELKRTTYETKEDWAHMKEMVLAINNECSGFSRNLENDLESVIHRICERFQQSFEEEIHRNESRFNNIQQKLDALVEEFHSLKHAFWKHCEEQEAILKNSSGVMNAESCNDKLEPLDLTVGWTQTETELISKKRNHSAQTKSLVGENETVKAIILAAKRSLNDVTREARKQLIRDREDKRRDMKTIFTHLEQDREDIKSTIIQALAVAAEKAKENYDQFLTVGQDAMHCVAVFHENTSKLLTARLDETDKRLREIFEAVNKQIFDISAIKSTLENIDDQFDDIYRRVELGYQKNTEHCEEVTRNLEVTMEEWNSRVVQLQETVQQFTQIGTMKDWLRYKNTTEVLDMPERTSTAFNLENVDISVNNFHSGDLTPSTNVSNQHQNHVNLLPIMVRTCLDKIDHFNKEMEKKSEKIHSYVQEITEKLKSLIEILGSVDDRFKFGENVFSSNMACDRKCTEIAPDTLNSESVSEIRATSSTNERNIYPLSALNDGLLTSGKKKANMQKMLSQIGNVMNIAQSNIQ
ncbi:cytadherence high molecular weight protein 2-like isoform X2 [Stegodyphus dumicola]|uniref:cytadherence high molecular weight protein 2-like isoform X2 n=1 Tax=Stegodyphus dumicola TaxID=202533 RepID=UPI0015AEF6D2|nr:cytadherence high molecular weight protein 2-like isoform X2 [Stegodyphus dumicola]